MRPGMVLVHEEAINTIIESLDVLIQNQNESTELLKKHRNILKKYL